MSTPQWRTSTSIVMPGGIRAMRSSTEAMYSLRRTMMRNMVFKGMVRERVVRLLAYPLTYLLPFRAAEAVLGSSVGTTFAM